MTVLVIAEHDGRMLNGATLNAIAAAGKLDMPVHVLVTGADARPAAEAAARAAGVAKVLLAQSPQFDDGVAESVAAQAVAMAGGYSHLFMAATAHGKSVAPRVAALLDVAQVSDVIQVVAPDTFKRPIYAGNAIETVRSGYPVVVATIRATAFDPAPAEGGNAAIETVAAASCDRCARFVSREIAVSERPDLGSARVVVSGGRGLGSAENFKLLDPLAEKLGAALGASRAAVDAGYAPNDWQVGQTGKIVAPELYVAVGISGAIQHLAGMKDAKTIVAINKDGDAPIFGVADYGLVGDLFDAVPTLTAALP
ncbi:FAD-binding protein [Achromobacter agilis]|uniref:Electron transfer flavoprotein subunit alpha n=1 Tax=Achromobacter agilis TaxID=1353888 RepID=A0A446CEA8_9BURK|nr:FAD-binding protein [Achromobacter agilis]SSW66165.1 Electron transfer flavoprotein subunit alpha [Achromobacter agilis]